MHNILLAFMILHLCILALLGWRYYDFRKALARHRPEAALPTNPPQVSVIVSARNEEREMANLLTDLLAQDYPALEILVVDDCSTDRTAEIVEDFASKNAHLQLIRGVECPAGWVGKCHAMHQGASRARGEWLLFMDADMRLVPQTISYAMQLATQNQTGLFSLIPRIDGHSFWEKLIMPTFSNMGMLLGAAIRIHNPRTPHALASGGFMLFNREIFDQMGGMESVKSEIVEDINLAMRVKQSGERTLFAAGFDLVSTHMYHGFREIWEGFSKNFFAATRYNWWILLVIFAGTIFIHLFPFAMLILTPILFPGQLALVLLPVLSCSGLLFYRYINDRYQGTLSWHALLHPFGVLMLGAIGLNSALCITFGKGAEWKGRKYPTKKT